MRGRRSAIDAQRHAARLGDLACDLGAGQDTAVAGLGALAQLQFDHLHLRIGRLVAEPLRVEPALRRPAAEIARADFPDDVAAPRAVMAADPALARVMGETALPRPP